jgi:2-keto-3-deoxy-L-rhamnonate aldolase RhmA
MSRAAARFRERLRSGQLCLGAGVSFTDPLVSEALAGSADFLFIDLEHSGLGHESLLGHLLAARGGCRSPRTSG